MTPTTELQKPVIKTELPGPKSLEIINADAEFVTPSYPRPDYKLVADHANGVWITDPDGNVFLDCNAGVAVCSTGHCHPEIVAAVQKQVSELIHLCGTDFYYRHMPELGKKLNEIVPTGQVHDGDAAVRQYFRDTRTAFPDQRNEPISLRHADDAVVVEFWLLGTQRGPLLGIAPTGRSFRVRMLALFLFEEGGDGIVCERVYFDSASLLRQLTGAS